MISMKTLGPEKPLPGGQRLSHYLMIEVRWAIDSLRARRLFLTT
jgi:hypothetical protein